MTEWSGTGVLAGEASIADVRWTEAPGAALAAGNAAVGAMDGTGVASAGWPAGLADAASPASAFRVSAGVEAAISRVVSRDVFAPSGPWTVATVRRALSVTASASWD